jgi:hypothetical protein
LTDVEVHLDLQGHAKRVGSLGRTPRSGNETVVLEWQADSFVYPQQFFFEPTLTIGPGLFILASGLKSPTTMTGILTWRRLAAGR